VEIVGLDFGNTLQEHRIGRVPPIEIAQQLECALRLVLVPEIEPVQLEVRFASQQLAALARCEHFVQALSPVAARQQQQPAQHAGRGGCDVRVIVIQPDAELGVFESGVERERAFER
jgi:hypothetical protein